MVINNTQDAGKCSEQRHAMQAQDIKVNTSLETERTRMPTAVQKHHGESGKMLKQESNEKAS